MKREVPLFLTAGIGLFMILSFFVPHQAVSVPADFLQACAIIVVGLCQMVPARADELLGERGSALERELARRKDDQLLDG